MKKFETNKKYSTRSICDSNCIFEFKVTKRTAKSVWVKGSELEEPVRRSIIVLDDQEVIYPYGKYSMAPSLRAN